MTVRFRSLLASLLPHGWRDAARQLSLGIGAYLAYSVVRGLAEGTPGAAFAHARDVISIERSLHVFIEPSIEGWASSSHLLIVIASWMYVNAQGPITICALVYLYLRHNGSFYFVRNMFVIALALALIGYIVFPTAPPRFLPEWGFSDPVAQFTPVNLHEHNPVMTALFNPYAAVPSVHVAFAVMIGWPIARLVRSRWAAFLWMLYPLVVTFVIVATANHFIVDALLGALTAAASAYGARWLARARPPAWSFRSVSPVRVPASG